MTIKVDMTHATLAATEADILIIFAFEGAGLTVAGKALDKALDGLVTDWIRIEEFKSARGEILEIQPHGKIPAKKIYVVGLGKKADFTAESLRRASAEAIKRTKGAKAVAFEFVLGGKVDRAQAASAIAFGARLGEYHFGKYFKEDKKKLIEQILVVEPDKRQAKAIISGLEHGRVIAEAVIKARDLVNEPASELTPVKFAEHAKALVKGTGILVKEIVGREAIKKLGMNAFLAVNKGSHDEPVLLHLSYKPAGKPKRKVALVGKGITFDTGGISLKPSSSLNSMKMDMSGAAVVVATIWAAAQLNSRVEVHAITALTDNMPGGGAYRPDDIYVAKNGKSIEIGNTDAEGRVTMADTLSYASELAPDEIIDVATLTGAMVAGLGNEIAGVMGTHGEPARILKAAKAAGEEMWELPLFEEYKALNKSQWADIKNDSSSRYGGGITAGLFLSEFVDTKIPWAHIDIAGPAWADAEKHYLTKEGTGYGVRTLVEYLTA